MNPKQPSQDSDRPDFQDRMTLEALLKSPPYHQVMGYELGNFDPENGILEIRQPFQDGIRRMEGNDQIHGGVIASLIDVAGTYALIMFINKGVPTINLRVDYLRAASGTDLLAKAVVRKNGRTIGTVDIEVHDANERLIAIGRAVFSTVA